MVFYRKLIKKYGGILSFFIFYFNELKLYVIYVKFIELVGSDEIDFYL